jgi:predicted ATPase
MPIIEGFRVKNYKTLQNITLGRLWNDRNKKPLKPLTAVIGKNGVGKSTLFDAFGFIADCLMSGVEEACYMRARGGFDRLRSQGQKEPIEFEIYYKESGNERPITYEFSIDKDADGRPYVSKERLRQRRKGQSRGWPFSFLILHEGKGVAWRGNRLGVKETDKFNLLDLIENIKSGISEEESRDTELVELDDWRRLGIATLGSLKQHPRISAFRKFIEGWYLSYFTPDAARGLPLAGPQKHLNIHGDNLANVVQFMERDHKKRFLTILEQISNKIPGIASIDTEKTNDGRLLLRFIEKGFEKPFYSQQMSDGTLKVFAYLLLLMDPVPPPFICVEEPENGLYHKLLEILATEFREHATGLKKGSQVFVTTHQPYFIDALGPDEVWVLEKNDIGFCEVKNASEIDYISNMTFEGQPLGSLWYSDYLGI